MKSFKHKNIIGEIKELEKELLTKICEANGDEFKNYESFLNGNDELLTDNEDKLSAYKEILQDEIKRFENEQSYERYFWKKVIRQQTYENVNDIRREYMGLVKEWI